MFDEAAGLQSAAAGAGQDEGEVVVRVAVGVGVAAAVDDHRVVQERIAVDVGHLAQLVEEPGEVPAVPEVDLGDLLDPIGPVLVVRQVVVAFGDADVFK